MEDFKSSVVSSPINQASSYSSSLTINSGNPTSSLTINSGNPTSFLIPNSDGPLAIDDYFNSFPAGYRFRPFDSELIVNYLETKIKNELLPPNKIHDVNLYTYNPQTLSEKYTTYGEKEWYFFTPRNRKYLNGKRPNRAAGDGYWKATGADKTIKFNGVTVGFRKVLVFYTGKPPKGDKSNWIMHEYRVSNPPKIERVVGDMKLDDWVLCKIYKKDDKTTGVKRQYQDDEIQNQQGQTKRISVEDSAVEGLPFDPMNSNYIGNIESTAIFGSYDVNTLHRQNRFAEGSQFLSLPSHQQQAMTKIDFSYPSDSKMTQPSELLMETIMLLEEFNQNRQREEPWDLSSQFGIINYDQFLENIKSIMPDNFIEPSDPINDDDSGDSDIN